MKNLKTSVRLVGYALLILLAMLGVGISGGVPINFTANRNDKLEVNTELVEIKEGDELSAFKKQK